MIKNARQEPVSRRSLMKGIGERSSQFNRDDSRIWPRAYAAANKRRYGWDAWRECWMP
jgi:hypothetical protein